MIPIGRKAILLRNSSKKKARSSIISDKMRDLKPDQNGVITITSLFRPSFARSSKALMTSDEQLLEVAASMHSQSICWQAYSC